ncbi:dihydropteroate synthase [Penaeicola halotolerans]|uniref:dihydropteroate synthase n=1 Tax=Penaeicola halotolerans TaxID=2793196 RepID=UPI0021D33EF8|nr:dihydropteroate synthase [Penaeicola halotolerans]
MGIINVTPDSFFAGSRINSEAQILAKAGQMLTEGADILDIGGYSSRPDASEVPTDEEISRVVRAVLLIKDAYPDAILSIDTFRAAVAQAAIEAGADLINDISAGLLDEQMLTIVGQLKVPYIAMHMRGTPQTMKGMTDYNDILNEIASYFAERVATCKAAGIHDLILDVGLGFAKTIDQNFFLLKNLSYFKQIGFPLLIGLSRKSMIYRTLEISPEEALNGSTALHMVALENGASILRVHDVKEAVEVVKLYKKITLDFRL